MYRALPNRFNRSVRSFLRHRSEGTVTVEAVIVTPLLIWAFAATFVFFEAMNVSTNGQKAAYTVADVLSRKATEAVDADYLDGMGDVYLHLTGTRRETAMRISSVGFDFEEEEYVIAWSYTTGELEGLNPVMINDGTPLPLLDSIMASIEPRMPLTPFGESLIVVETMLDYRPSMRVGLDPQVIYNVVITRPRFAPQLMFDNGTLEIELEYDIATCDDGPPLCDLDS